MRTRRPPFPLLRAWLSERAAAAVSSVYISQRCGPLELDATPNSARLTQHNSVYSTVLVPTRRRGKERSISSTL
ncbi:hypothetical protein AMELA_G00268460 [Ameiurus melas]|uniref:Uncharacterized protein n=1 Tax=Ameiurus melas TaxID=219545 RepID=A0A7J5ZN80_AMEME|nr:hypothetical protein AMELA_G00268460 [Ameiurus melas]